MDVVKAKTILETKFPDYRILNVRKFNNRYIFEALPPNASLDWDAYYAVDLKGNITYFSPVFVNNPADFLKLKPMVDYTNGESDSYE